MQSVRGREIGIGEGGVHAVVSVRGPANGTGREIATEIVRGTANASENTLNVPERGKETAIVPEATSVNIAKFATHETTKNAIHMKSLDENTAAVDLIATRTAKEMAEVVVCEADAVAIREWIVNANCVHGTIESPVV